MTEIASVEFPSLLPPERRPVFFREYYYMRTALLLGPEVAAYKAFAVANARDRPDESTTVGERLYWRERGAR